MTREDIQFHIDFYQKLIDTPGDFRIRIRMPGDEEIIRYRPMEGMVLEHFQKEDALMKKDSQTMVKILVTFKKWLDDDPQLWFTKDTISKKSWFSKEPEECQLYVNISKQKDLKVLWKEFKKCYFIEDKGELMMGKLLTYG